MRFKGRRTLAAVLTLEYLLDQIGLEVLTEIPRIGLLILVRPWMWGKLSRVPRMRRHW